MFCPNCGSATGTAAAFCSSCGRPLSIAGSSAARMRSALTVRRRLLVAVARGRCQSSGCWGRRRGELGGGVFISTRDTPSRAAEQLIQSLAERDGPKMINLTCQAKQSEARSGADKMTETTTSNMAFEALREVADDAVTTSTLGRSQAQELNLRPPHETRRWTLALLRRDEVSGQRGNGVAATPWKHARSSARL